MAYRRREGFSSFRPSPVEVGGEYDVSVTELSRRGDAGVAKVQGFVIFVEGAKPGDNVKVRVTKVGRGYAVAQVI
ncbi:23S rRNA (uracil-C(5))-methyltransferase RlmCD [archaeon HR01]|nr:23S rRNA (uracil-C(5))-methyltransferase RlmCD [archaeon HR01]